jgi:hypothetical protein
MSDKPQPRRCFNCREEVPQWLWDKKYRRPLCEECWNKFTDEMVELDVSADESQAYWLEFPCAPLGPR